MKLVTISVELSEHDAHLLGACMHWLTHGTGHEAVEKFDRLAADREGRSVRDALLSLESKFRWPNQWRSREWTTSSQHKPLPMHGKFGMPSMDNPMGMEPLPVQNTIVPMDNPMGREE